MNAASAASFSAHLDKLRDESEAAEAWKAAEARELARIQALSKFGKPGFYYHPVARQLVIQQYGWHSAVKSSIAGPGVEVDAGSRPSRPPSTEFESESMTHANYSHGRSTSPAGWIIGLLVGISIILITWSLVLLSNHFTSIDRTESFTAVSVEYVGNNASTILRDQSGNSLVLRGHHSIKVGVPLEIGVTVTGKVDFVREAGAVITP